MDMGRLVDLQIVHLSYLQIAQLSNLHIVPEQSADCSGVSDLQMAQLSDLQIAPERSVDCV